jgi:hypothetical protein
MLTVAVAFLNVDVTGFPTANNTKKVTDTKDLRSDHAIAYAVVQ